MDQNDTGVTGNFIGNVKLNKSYNLDMPLILSFLRIDRYD
jgi:hypothetical protein